MPTAFIPRLSMLSVCLGSFGSFRLEGSAGCQRFSSTGGKQGEIAKTPLPNQPVKPMALSREMRRRLRRMAGNRRSALRDSRSAGQRAKGAGERTLSPRVWGSGGVRIQIFGADLENKEFTRIDLENKGLIEIDLDNKRLMRKKEPFCRRELLLSDVKSRKQITYL